MKKSKDKEANMVIVSCKLEKEIWKKVKLFAIQNDETISQTTRKALEDYLKKNSGKKDADTK